MNIFSIKLLKPAIVMAAIAMGALAILITEKNDTPIEQIAETILKTQGIDVDLSPND